MKKGGKWYLIAIILVTVGLLLTSVGLGSAASEKPSVLRILYATDEAGVKSLASVVPEYEKLSGIKIELDPNPFVNLMEKTFSELGSRSPHYDLFCFNVPDGPKLIHHIRDMAEFMLDPAVADPKILQVEDFTPKIFLDTVVYHKEDPHRPPPWDMDPIDPKALKDQGYAILGLPIFANVETVTFRKDLFEKEAPAYKAKYGTDLKAPETWDELLQVAEFFTRPPDMYGWAIHAGKSETTVWGWATHLHQLGGDIFDYSTMEPTVNAPPAIEATQYWYDLVHKYKIVPPGSINYTFADVTEVFRDGLIVMGPNWHNMEVSDDIRAAGGEVGFAMMPGRMRNGKLDRQSHQGTWYLGISKYSKNPVAAYKLAEWLTSAAAQKKMARFQHHVTRRSVITDQDFLAETGFAEYYKVMADAYEIAFGRPRLVNYSEFNELGQIAISDATGGRRPIKEALDEWANEINRIMEKEY